MTERGIRNSTAHNPVYLTESRNRRADPFMKNSIYMRRKNPSTIATLLFASAIVFLISGIGNAQIRSAGGGWYVAGYGTVYGSFGQASASQNLYSTMQTHTRKTATRNALIKKWGLAAVEKAEREAASGSAASPNSKIVVPRPPLVRNYGVFRPDPTVDTGKTLADNLADTPEEKALIKRSIQPRKNCTKRKPPQGAGRIILPAG